jgi:hypothetical protein
MFERVMLGLGRRMIPLPETVFRAGVRWDAAKLDRRPDLAPDERRVHHHAVREIPTRRRPISPQAFADELGLELDEVERILDGLERRMTYLCRRGGEDVVWAYPVTAEATVHRVSIDGGGPFSAA